MNTTATLRDRPCLVCEKPCRTEGQLCPTCCNQGHNVTDDAVHLAIDIGTTDRLA